MYIIHQLHEIKRASVLFGKGLGVAITDEIEEVPPSIVDFLDAQEGGALAAGVKHNGHCG